MGLENPWACSGRRSLVRNQSQDRLAVTKENMYQGDSFQLSCKSLPAGDSSKPSPETSVACEGRYLGTCVLLRHIRNIFDTEQEQSTNSCNLSVHSQSTDAKVSSFELLCKSLPAGGSCKLSPETSAAREGRNTFQHRARTAYKQL